MNHQENIVRYNSLKPINSSVFNTKGTYKNLSFQNRKLYLFAEIVILILGLWATSTCAATYSYDDLNRLKTVTYDSGQTVEYTYDPAGNILTTATAVANDTDNDGIADTTDNCTTIPNPTQTDTDGDNIGNACDPDFNQNGIVDQFDFSQLKACFGSTTCIPEDLNGNGVVDQFDFSRLKGMFGQPPGPSALVNNP